MPTFFHKSLIFYALSLFFIAFSGAQAQPSPKAKERMRLIMKMKLLEELELDDAVWKKFNDVYTAWDKKIDGKREELFKAVDDLDKALKKKKTSATDIKNKTDKYIKIEQELRAYEDQRLKDIKAVLDEAQFAKFIVFEHKIRKEIMHEVMKRSKDFKEDKKKKSRKKRDIDD